MSSDNKVRSASMPGCRLPDSFVREARVRGVWVYARSVSSNEIRSCGCHPSGLAPSMVRRVTAASMPRIGSMGATVQSEPNARVAPGVQEGAEGIRSLDALRPDPLLGPSTVVRGVVRLHGRDHTLVREALDGLGREVLGVLDTEAPVALAVHRRRLAIDVQHPVVGPVADGVDHDLETRGVRSLDPLAQARRSRWS